MKSKAGLSVIIPTQNRIELLRNCLNSLLSQTKQANEIIVIDNSLSQTVRNLVIQFRKKSPIEILYFHETKPGSPYARNLGMRVANYDILAFTDDDCRATDTWIEEIWKTYKKFNCSAIQGKSINGNPDNIYSCVEYFNTKLIFGTTLYRKDNQLYSQYLDTKNFSFKKSSLKKQIYFDEIFAPFSILEDLDFALELRRNGVDILYNLDLVVCHYGKKNAFQHFRREIQKGRAFYHYWRKWKCNQELSILIKSTFHNSSKLNNYLSKRQAEIEQFKQRLRQKIFADRNILFILFFYLLTWFSYLVRKLSYHFEMISCVFLKKC